MQPRSKASRLAAKGLFQGEKLKGPLRQFPCKPPPIFQACPLSRFTSGYLFGLIAAVLGVIGVNYVFTYPYMAFNFTISGYPLTMFTFLVVSLVTSTLTTKTKEQDRLRMENEKVKMRADLLRSVSHDIRTPLTSIMGATSAILENPALSPAEQQSLLVDVRDDAQWLIRVVENLLSITRIGNESAKITKEPEAAEEVLDEAVRKFRKRFPAVSVEVHVPDELLLVPMDAILIMQVLSNLMENAAKKTAGVQNAVVNFMTQKMIVEFEDGQEPRAVMQAVLKACKKVEPDCEIAL